MLSQTSQLALAVVRAAEELDAPAVPAWVVGGGALVFLLLLLLGLIAFGGGREHS